MGYGPVIKYHLVDHWVLVLLLRFGPLAIPDIVERSKRECFNLESRVVERAVERLAVRARIKVFDRQGPRKARRWVLWDYKIESS